MQATRNRQPVPDHYDVLVPGNVVQLPIGGPLLMVVDVCDYCGEVETVYADSNDDLVFNTFPADTLVRVE